MKTKNMFKGFGDKFNWKFLGKGLVFLIMVLISSLIFLVDFARVKTSLEILGTKPKSLSNSLKNIRSIVFEFSLLFVLLVPFIFILLYYF